MRFSHRIRVRFSEVDGQRVVYFANYLTYFDVALTEFYRSSGIAPLLPRGLEFHVVHASADYFDPIRYDEEIDVAVEPERIGTSSVTFRMAIFGSGRQEVKAGGLVVWALTDQSSRRSAAIPETVRQELRTPPAASGTGSDGAGPGAGAQPA